MRFSPDGQFVSFTAGYGGGALSVCVVEAATGKVITRLPGGHDPCWIGAYALIARSLDGTGTYAEQDGFACGYVGANDGDLDAAAGRAAFTPDRGVGVTVYIGGKPQQNYPSTFEPRLSAGATLVVRDLASGSLRLERLPGCTDAAGPADCGPGTRPRWSSQTLVWDTLPYGRVLGRSSPDQPTVDLSVPGHACTFPVALWTGAVLVVGLILDDGDLTVCEWGSLLARQGTGWPIARSGGSAFDWDLAILGGDPQLVRVAYLTESGDLALTSIDLTSPQKNLTSEVKPPEPEPGPGPGPEPGPEPLPPDPPLPVDPGTTPLPPEPLPPEGIVIEFAELRNMEMRLEDTYKNHGGHPPVSYTIHVNQEGFIWRQHYWDRRKAGMDHETAIRSIESDIDVIEGRPDRWAPIPPEPGVAGPIAGPLGVEGRHFTVPG